MDSIDTIYIDQEFITKNQRKIKQEDIMEVFLPENNLHYKINKTYKNISKGLYIPGYSDIVNSFKIKLTGECIDDSLYNGWSVIFKKEDDELLKIDNIMSNFIELKLSLYTYMTNVYIEIRNATVDIKMEHIFFTNKDHRYFSAKKLILLEDRLYKTLTEKDKIIKIFTYAPISCVKFICDDQVNNIIINADPPVSRRKVKFFSE